MCLSPMHPITNTAYRGTDEGPKQRGVECLPTTSSIGGSRNGLFFSPALSTVAVKSLERGVELLAADSVSPTEGSRITLRLHQARQKTGESKVFVENREKY